MYRLEEFLKEKDTELLLGTEVDPVLFSDHNLGRVLDKIFDACTQKVFSKIAQIDTTPIGVFSDYDLIDPPFKTTYGLCNFFTRSLILIVPPGSV